jgi:hypothetical protein
MTKVHKAKGPIRTTIVKRQKIKCYQVSSYPQANVCANILLYQVKRKHYYLSCPWPSSLLIVG